MIPLAGRSANACFLAYEGSPMGLIVVRLGRFALKPSATIEIDCLVDYVFPYPVVGSV